MAKIKDYDNEVTVTDDDKVIGTNESGVTKNFTMAKIKTYTGEGTATPYIDVVDVGDDKGLIFTEQMSVGSPGNPKESVFGGGDSYGVGKEDTTPDGTPVAGSAWHCEISNTSGNTITSATDVTIELSSDSGSTIPLFNGTTAGKYLLLGSDYEFGGMKVKTDTAGVIESGHIVMEFLWDNSPTWEDAPFMATGSGFPYTQKADILTTLNSEQWRMGFNPLSPPSVWNKVTLNINGTNYTKYWVRIRITDAITTDAILEQIKLHTDRFEINADGATEYFGRSRYNKDIITGITNKITNINKNPANEDISIASGITMDINDNEFVNNAEDGFIIPINIVEGLDTSIPLRVFITGYPKSASAGTIKLGLDYVAVGDGFIYDGSATPVHLEATDTFPGGNLKRRDAAFAVPINTLIPGEQNVLSLYRMGNDVEDTLNANIVITNVRVIGTFWRP